jgi:hypothetical protein
MLVAARSSQDLAFWARDRQRSFEIRFGFRHILLRR